MHASPLLRRCAAGLLLLALLMGPAFATWSIVATNTETGEVAVASATCLANFDLEFFLPVIVPEVGAGAAQSFVDQGGNNRSRMFTRLRLGWEPADILDYLFENDQRPNGRQYGIADLVGRKATFTGFNAGRWRGGVTGQVGSIHYAIQGNVLTGSPVIAEAENAFVNTPGDLGQKLMAAMEAARAMGGDGRCSCSTVDPEACGSPPPDFQRSAYVGFVIVSRPGDALGTCSGNFGCANSDYYLNLNVDDGNNQTADPVIRLRNMYNAWRLGQAGRPDAVHSAVSPPRASAPAGSPGPVLFQLALADVEQAAITSGGAAVSVTHDSTSAGVSALQSVTDHGDGTYTIAMLPGAGPGLDRLRVVVDDGVRPVTIWPMPVLLTTPAEQAPYNDLQPVPGLDSPAKDRFAKLLPDGLTAYLLSTRNLRPKRLMRATRPDSSAPFGPAADVPGIVGGPNRRVTGFWISADEQLLVLSALVGGETTERLYDATRPDPLDPFFPPALMEELDADFDTGGPFLSPDKLTIYFHSARPGGGGGGLDLWRARRRLPGGRFFPPEPLTGLNTPADESYPVLVENGTRLLFARSSSPEEPCFADLDDFDDFAADAPLPGAVHPVQRAVVSSEEGGGEFLWISLAEASYMGDLVRARRTTAALTADAASVSAAAGGTIQFSLEAGTAWAGAGYLLLIGGSGPRPGIRTLDAVLPLKQDAATLYARRRANSAPFLGFAGALDGLGRGAAQLTLAPGAQVPAAWLNRPFLATFLAFQGRQGFAGNTVGFEIHP